VHARAAAICPARRGWVACSCPASVLDRLEAAGWRSAACSTAVWVRAVAPKLQGLRGQRRDLRGGALAGVESLSWPAANPTRSRSAAVAAMAMVRRLSR
jgi:hypothetical protein